MGIHRDVVHVGNALSIMQFDVRFGILFMPRSHPHVNSVPSEPRNAIYAKEETGREVDAVKNT